MLAREFITEKKKKKKRKSKKTKLSKYFFPGFAYYGFSGDSGDSGGGDGGGGESVNENEHDYLQTEVTKFVDWASQRLHLKQVPKVILSYDHDEAQKNHHTGSHVFGSGKVWVYAKNRNLVDILRTVFHELVHVRQEELNMVKPGSSYPGSPIEAMADMLAGKYIKIYGKTNRNIFQ